MMNWWRRQSLHTQLLLVSSLIMMLTLIVATLWSMQKERARLVQEHLRQDRSLARMIALASGYHVISGRLDELESLLLKFGLFPSVRELAVLDMKGRVLSRVLVTKQDGPTVAYDRLQMPIPQKGSGDGERIKASSHEVVVWHPVETSTQLGWVKLVTDTGDIQAVVENIQKSNLRNAILILILDVMILYLILHFPRKSFRQAVKFASQMPHMPGKHLDIRAGSREVGELVQALNHASDELNSSQQALRTLNAELEQRVQNRTEALLDSQERNLLLRQAIDQSSVGMAMLDQKFRLQDHNPAFREITGHDNESLRDRHLLETLWSKRNPTGLYEDLIHHLRHGIRWHGEFIANGRNEKPLWLNMTATSVTDHHQRQHHLLTMENITERKQYEEQLIHQANFDALTGLPNRMLGMDRLKHAIQRDQRAGNKTALMFLDLDRFKEINDTLGHRTGDLLLIETAGRLTGCIREEDTVARLGGDEFLIIISGIREPTGMEAVADKILRHMAQPFHLGGRELHLGASIGIAVAPDDTTDPETLLRFADTAMYQAKREGRNRFHYYTHTMNQAAFARLRIGQALHKALEQNELTLELQPIFTADERRFAGAEALLRWHSAELGAVMPNQFIPIAEENGQIVEIGRWALFRACHLAASWRHHGFISVNVAFQQFRDPAFAANVQEALELSGLAAERLHLEITERVLMLEENHLSKQIQQLQTMGVKFSIDDFGTGYSSLSYLRRFPCHALKIDRTFVQALTQDDEDARALVEAIMGMGHALGLQIIAEGVEMEEQAHLLQEQGCDLLQGFLLARPMQEQAFARFLQHGTESA